MRLLTYDEITPSMAPGRTFVHSSAFMGAPLSPAQVSIMRRGGFLADYGGLFAVEGGEVVGQTWVHRYPYQTPQGPETLGGIAAVATSPAQGRRGIARRVLTEVQAREREAGVGHLALWTNRSWGAHRLYESLGYRDVYHIPVALRSVPVREPRPTVVGVTVRRARRSDLARLEALHERTTRRRLGFVPRRPGVLRTQVSINGVEVLKNLWVALRAGTPSGYVQVDIAYGKVRCAELIAADVRTERALVAQVEHLARGRWASFEMVCATDEASRLRRLGYSSYARSWMVMMGADPRGPRPAKQLVKELGTADPRWLCLRNDRF